MRGIFAPACLSPFRANRVSSGLGVVTTALKQEDTPFRRIVNRIQHAPDVDILRGVTVRVSNLTCMHNGSWFAQVGWPRCTGGDVEAGADHAQYFPEKRHRFDTRHNLRLSGLIRICCPSRRDSLCQIPGGQRFFRTSQYRFAVDTVSLAIQQFRYQGFKRTLWFKWRPSSSLSASLITVNS